MNKNILIITFGVVILVLAYFLTYFITYGALSNAYEIYMKNYEDLKEMETGNAYANVAMQFSIYEFQDSITLQIIDPSNLFKDGYRDYYVFEKNIDGTINLTKLIRRCRARVLGLFMKFWTEEYNYATLSSDFEFIDEAIWNDFRYVYCGIINNTFIDPNKSSNETIYKMPHSENTCDYVVAVHDRQLIGRINDFALAICQSAMQQNKTVTVKVDETYFHCERGGPGTGDIIPVNLFGIVRYKNQKLDSALDKNADALRAIIEPIVA